MKRLTKFLHEYLTLCDVSKADQLSIISIISKYSKLQLMKGIFIGWTSFYLISIAVLYFACK